MVSGNTAALLIQYPLPFEKSYLYCPSGPLLPKKFPPDWNTFGSEVHRVVATPANVFLKIEPWDSCVDPNALAAAGFRVSTPIQPEMTRIIDIAFSEEELMRKMAQSARYDIKTAQKRGVVVHIAARREEKEKAFDEFWTMFKMTNDRKKLKYHSKEYYWLVAMLNGDCHSKIFLAKTGETLASGAMTVYFGRTAFYLYAASMTGSRYYKAPSLVLWAIMVDAMKSGMTTLNTGGISHAKKSMAGPTAFKKNFGGYEHTYPGAWDLPLNKLWYGVYRLAKKVL